MTSSVYDYTPMTYSLPRVVPLEERFRRRARLAVCERVEVLGWTRREMLDILMALGLVDYEGKIQVVATS